MGIAAELAANKDADAYHVMFNTFKSAIAYEPTIVNCPNYLKENEAALESGSDQLYPAALEGYEFEPENSTEALENLQQFALASTVYLGMIEGAASEESSRMAAMDNAAKNCGEYIQNLTLKYNRARQAAITTELIEIISGAAALDG